MPASLDLAQHMPAAALLIAVLLLAAFLRRIPIVGRLFDLSLLVGLAFILATLVDQRGRTNPYVASIMRALNLAPTAEQVTGKETRVRMSPDGHFWVTVRFGDTTRRMLVDSGATVTALSADSASDAGLDVQQPAFPILIRTANGTIHAQTSTIDEMRLGNVVARALPVVVSPAFGDVDVLGMNFLSRLQSWRVEGNTLILVPHHPQERPAAA